MNDELAKLVRHAESRVDHKVVAIEDQGQTVVLGIEHSESDGGRRVIPIHTLTDPLLEKPRRPMGVHSLATIDSLIDYAKRHIGDGKHACAYVSDKSDGRVSATVVLNDHGEGNADAGWTDFKAAASFDHSEAWKRWTSVDGKWLSQQLFAELLEDGLNDVLPPTEASEALQQWARLHRVHFADQTRLAEVARGLSVAVNQRVTNAKNLSSGEAEFAFAEEHTDSTGGTLSVPKGFVLSVRIVRGGVYYAIAARLRYRVAAGAISWQVRLANLEEVRELFVTDLIERLRGDLEIPVFHSAE